MSLELTVERELKSPNRWQGRHWRYKHRESQEWEQAVWTSIAVLGGARSLRDCLLAQNADKRVCQGRRKVSVVRQVPSLRNFIKDDDNLRFAVKPLNDALKRLGLIHDDSRKWLEQTLPTQAVSSDGKYYTRILIEPVEGAAAGSEAGQ